jgi:archaellum component FlaC
MLNENERAKYEEKIMQLESLVAKATNDANSAKTEYQEKLQSLDSTNSIANKQLQELSNNIEKLTLANSAAKKVSK